MELTFSKKPRAAKSVKIKKMRRGGFTKSSAFEALDGAIVNLKVGQILTVDVPEGNKRDGTAITAEDLRRRIAQRIISVIRKRQMKEDGVKARHQMSKDFRAVLLEGDDGEVDESVVGIECIENDYTEEQELADMERSKKQQATKKAAKKASKKAAVVEDDDIDEDEDDDDIDEDEDDDIEDEDEDEEDEDEEPAPPPRKSKKKAAAKKASSKKASKKKAKPVEDDDDDDGDEFDEFDEL